MHDAGSGVSDGMLQERGVGLGEAIEEERGVAAIEEDVWVC